MNSRYIRQTVLPEVGESGQIQLGQARILVIGVGGLGSPVLTYLVAAGVGLGEHGGSIGVCDDDRVDESNLQRQIIFQETDEQLYKVDSAIAHLRKLNSHTQLIAHRCKINASNVLAIMADYDIIVDGSDNFTTKYILNDAAVKLGKPIVYGSILGLEGQASVFWSPFGPCYRCLFPHMPTHFIPNCQEAGTLGGVAGMIGSIQAVEACKLALTKHHPNPLLSSSAPLSLPPLIGKLLIIDAHAWDIHRLTIEKDNQCPVCSLPKDHIMINESKNTTATIYPTDQKNIDLTGLSELIKQGVAIKIIDVRDTHEWQRSHVKGAIHISLGNLLSNSFEADTLSPNDTLIVYCQHGIRSAKAAQFLAVQGYKVIQLHVDWAQVEK